MNDHLKEEDLVFMRIALEQAAQSASIGEVPIGAVLMHQGTIVAQSHNHRETWQDPTAHAEMIAITQAAQAVQSWRLDDCLLYVTLEPCQMCAGAVVLARLPLVVYGCTDPKAGACDTLYRIPSDGRLNHRAQVVGGVLSERCAAILGEFFAGKRRLGKK